MAPAEHVVKDIRRQARQRVSAENKIRIVLDGLRGAYSIAELCRKEGIAQSLYHCWTPRRTRRFWGSGGARARAAIRV